MGTRVPNLQRSTFGTGLSATHAIPGLWTSWLTALRRNRFFWNVHVLIFSSDPQTHLSTVNMLSILARLLHAMSVHSTFVLMIVVRRVLRQAPVSGDIITVTRELKGNASSKFYIIEIRDGAPCLTRLGSRDTLHRACMAGYLDLIERLISSKGVNVDVKDDDGFTPLARSIQHNLMDVVELLIRLGAEVNIETATSVRKPPLYSAIENDNRNMVLMLLLAGAEIQSIYINACKNVEMLKLLVDFGADIHATIYDGYTPLSLACENGQADLVIYLIEQWADHKYKYVREEEYDYDYDFDSDDYNAMRFEIRGNAIVIAEGEGYYDLADEMRLAILARIRRRQAARIISSALAKNAKKQRRRRNLQRAHVLCSQMPGFDSGVMDALADSLEAQH